MNQNVWKMFFDRYAPRYMNESFTKNTKQEVDFIQEEFKLPKGSYILDVGCGTGRHSVELAKRGYNVTGIDISEEMLKEARKHCVEEGVAAEFIQADATNFIVDKLYDACICLCEGAFGLLSEGEDPFERDIKILRNVNKALKNSAKFLLTALNGLRMIRMYNDEDVAKGIFDPLGIVETHPMLNYLENAPQGIFLREKGFIAVEIVLMLKMTGFVVENIWGGTAGSWNRQPLRMDEMEIMIVSKKVEDCS
ncbi:MAG TPA: class I SAM-dependent methyltransferase [Pseudothermotoga sp.]